MKNIIYENKKLSDKVIDRLTMYHCILVDYVAKEIETISSPQIASMLKIDDSQVRKDISLLNNSGKCRVGYIVKDLKSAIEKSLGFKKPKNAFIIGSGNLGMALARYDNFSSYGLNVLALFDNDIKKIASNINNKKIFHIDNLTNLASKMNVDIAILTVPANVAQVICDRIIEANIKYIWNFTPTILNIPDDVNVFNENLMGSFLQFAYKIVQ